MIHTRSQRTLHTGSAATSGWSNVGFVDGGDECVVDDFVGPAVFDVADASDKGMVGKSSAPVVGCGDELLDDVWCANLEEVNCAGREGECPYVRSSFGISRMWKRASDGLSE